LPGIILAALSLAIREPRRGAAEQATNAGRCRAGSPYALIFGLPTMVWIIASGALHNFNMYAVNSFMVAFLSRYHHLNLKEATFTAAVVLGAVGVIGLVAGGWLGDQVGQRRTGGRVLVAGIHMLLATPCLYFAIKHP